MKLVLCLPIIFVIGKFTDTFFGGGVILCFGWF